MTKTIMDTIFPDLDWETGNHYTENEHAIIELGPFIIRIEKEYDDDFGYDMGKGISNPEPGAIRHHGDWNSYKWYLPDTTAEEHYLELAKDATWTIEECRQEASKYAMQDYKRWADYGSSWSYLYIKVTILYLGYEIGEAGCGGVESDSDDDHIFTIALEDMGDAINQALNALEEFKDAPSYLLVELDAKIDAAFKESYDAQRATWSGPTASGRPFNPKISPRDPKDIPAYVPVDEDEYRIIYCPICEDGDITDEEYQYTLNHTDIVMCSDCYYQRYEEAEQALYDGLDSTDGVPGGFPVWQIEAKMAQMRREEISE